MVSYLSRDYIFRASGGYSFGFSAGDGKGGLGPSTKYHYFSKFDCCIGGVNFVSYMSSDYQFMTHSNKDRYSYLFYWR